MFENCFGRQRDMEPFTALTALAAPFDRSNVDTDQIIPARFLRRPREQGYADLLFHDLRFSAPGVERPDFVLNRTPYRNARILVANRNFGGGSSREQAVWSLVDFGIRCVVAASFGDIFYDNSIKGGLLLIRQPEDRIAALRAQLHERPGATVTADLERQTLTSPDGVSSSFVIEAGRRKRLLLGLDDIGLTLQFDRELAVAEEAYRKRYPWLSRHAASEAPLTR